MRFLLALSFLTSIPVPIGRIMTEEDLGHATRWFPAVGAVMGGILWGVFRLTSLIWSVQISGAVTLVVWTVLTRGLHLDGLADTFDGLGGGATRERALEIMKDSRIGTFGAVAIFGVLALKLSVLISIGPGQLPWIMVAPILARWTLVLAVAGFPTARKDGMGRRFKSYCGLAEIILASAIAFLSVMLLCGWMGLVAIGTAGLVMSLAGYMISRSLGGLTGDSYGCICETVELAVLLLGAAFSAF